MYYLFTDSELVAIDVALDTTLREYGLEKLGECAHLLKLFSIRAHKLEDAKIVQLDDDEIKSLNDMFDLVLKKQGINAFNMVKAVDKVLSNPVNLEDYISPIDGALSNKSAYEHDDEIQEIIEDGGNYVQNTTEFSGEDSGD